MPATITLQVCNGLNAATESTVLGVMMRANDSAATDVANPITVPTGAPVYSYEKWLRFKCTAPPVTQVTNFKYWGPNSLPGTGLVLFAGTNATGVTPVTTASAVAVTQQDTNYYSAGTALGFGGTLVNINDESEYIVLQLQVSSTASQGNIAQQTHNYSYDEN